MVTAELNSHLSTLTGARQTMLSWAKVIECLEAVPEAYRNSYSRVLGNEPNLPYTVLAPAIAGFGHQTTEKLLCAMHETIYVWERVGHQVALAAYPLESISDLELGNILLYSWITIGGVTKAGEITSSTIEFNTATDRHFARFVNKIRPAPDGREPGMAQAQLDCLATEDFKFMNFARDSLVQGEQVHQIVWQPKISKPVVQLWGHTFYQTLCLTHLAILTDKEFIVIQDDERSRENRGVRYGGKWRYIALNHIGTVELLTQGESGLILSIGLVPGGRRLEIMFAVARKEALVQLQDRLKRLKG